MSTREYSYITAPKWLNYGKMGARQIERSRLQNVLATGHAPLLQFYTSTS